jgi:hypothetical protein
MKNCYFVLFILHFFTPSIAQKNISNAYFPKIGSRLTTALATRTSALSIYLSNSGQSNLTWDFRKLQSQNIDNQYFIEMDTMNKRRFPTANIRLKDEKSTPTLFYRRTDSIFEVVGMQGILFQGLFIQTTIHPHTPFKERRTPIRIGDTFQQMAGFTVTFPPSAAPDSLLGTAPFAIPDSVRLTYNVFRQDTIDGWGTVRLPSGDFSVLRERRKESIKNKIEILYPKAGWLDVTRLVLSGLSEPPASERFYQIFWNENVQEPIAIVATNALAQVEEIRYKAIETSVKVIDVTDIEDNITIYPNPTASIITVDIENILPSATSLQIIDISGKIIDTQTVYLQKSIVMDVADWSSGIYLLTFTDKNSNILARKRLIKY